MVTNPPNLIDQEPEPDEWLPHGWTVKFRFLDNGKRDKGLWGGMIAGTALQTLLFLIVLYKTNWTSEVALTSERMRK